MEVVELESPIMNSIQKGRLNFQPLDPQRWSWTSKNVDEYIMTGGA